MKRVFDIVISLAALILLSPIIVLVLMVVRLKLGSPVLFSQIRPGLNGEPFTMYKVRSMCDAIDSEGRSLPDSERLTAFGLALRSTSLDELPALYNVFRGEMSLVGPRPLLMEYLPLYSQQQAKRHNVLPGITGWAQVNGRNALSWEAKFKYDVWYVENQSIGLDMKILYMTVYKVFKRDGISDDSGVTMQRFKGEHKPAVTSSDE